MDKQIKVIICGFPGVGKSTLQKDLESKNIHVEDSDSSLFPKDNFPENYIKHIGEDLDKKGVKFVSTHKEVLEGLEKAGIEYALVYPKREDKDLYVQRYIERGSPQAFVDLLTKKWDAFMDDIQTANPTKRIELKTGQYLSDVVKFK